MMDDDELDENVDYDDRQDELADGDALVDDEDDEQACDKED